MHWKNVNAVHLAQAMTECEELGLVEFRNKYGFKPANAVGMWKAHRGPFEARCLVAAAFSKQFPRQSRLTPKAFMGTDAHVFLVKVHGIHKATAQP
jgi:hypothetical protein